MAAVLDHARTVGGPALRALTFAERGALLRAATDALQAHRNELLDLAVANGGNTRGDAKFDVDGAIFTLAAYADIGKALGAARVLVDGEGVTLGRSPRFHGQHIQVTRTGVAIHINAFNFPAWGMAEKAAAALLAGMPVVSKPATSSAMVAHRMMEILVEAKALARGRAVAARGILGRPAGARRPLRRGGLYRLQRHRGADPLHAPGHRELGAGERGGGQPERRRPRPRRRAGQRDVGLLRQGRAAGHDAEGRAEVHGHPARAGARGARRPPARRSRRPPFGHHRRQSRERGRAHGAGGHGGAARRRARGRRSARAGRAAGLRQRRP